MLRRLRAAIAARQAPFDGLWDQPTREKVWLFSAHTHRNPDEVYSHFKKHMHNINPYCIEPPHDPYDHELVKEFYRWIVRQEPTLSDISPAYSRRDVVAWFTDWKNALEDGIDVEVRPTTHDFCLELTISEKDGLHTFVVMGSMVKSGTIRSFLDLKYSGLACPRIVIDPLFFDTLEQRVYSKDDFLDRVNVVMNRILAVVEFVSGKSALR